MDGKGVIVMRISDGISDNGHRYYEHPSLQGATAEARRLAENIDGDFVIYVPVAIITKAPKTVAEVVQIPDASLTLDDSLPFWP